MPLPTNTLIRTQTNLEIFGARLDPLEYDVNQDSPLVHVTQKKLRHTKRTTRTTLNHHTHTTHTGNRKRPRKALDPTPEQESTQDIPSLYTNHLPSIETPNAPKKTKNSHPNPPTLATSKHHITHKIPIPQTPAQTTPLQTRPSPNHMPTNKTYKNIPTTS